MKDQVKIPMSFILEMDDVGWTDGRDLNCEGKASRSGIDRDHCIEDYEMIKAITDATGKNVATALVVGDWDKENFLRGEIGLTHDPYGWDQKSKVDWDYHRKCLEVLESARVDYMLHGVLHSRYDEMGRRITDAEHLIIEKKPDGSHTRRMIPEEDFRRHLDLFFQIYNSWGLKRKIVSYVTPCGNRDSTEENTIKMAKILSEYGIRYWANTFPHFPEGCTLKVYHGVACFRWGQAIPGVEWDEKSTNGFERPIFTEETTKKFSCFQGSHWTNYLNLDPKKNIDNLPGWLDLYKRQQNHFGCVLAEDLAEAVNQHFYWEFAKVEYGENQIRIDLTEVMKNAMDCHKKEFFLSVKKGLVPKGVEGGEISLHEELQEFCTYKISHKDSIVTVNF